MIYLPYSSTGEILQATSSPVEGNESEYTSVIPNAVGTVTTSDSTVSPGTHRINLSTLAPEDMPYMSVSTTYSTTVNSSISITGLPNCTTYYYEDADIKDGDDITTLDLPNVEVSDGQLDFTSDLAGEYTLVFSAPLYLGTTTVITVTD